MTKTYGSTAKVKMDQPDRLSRRSTEKDMRRILELVVEVRSAFDQAVEVGVYSPRGDGNGRGKGFTDVRPTESAVFSPTRSQVRRAARQAAEELSDAKAALELAADILHRGLFRTDPEVLGQFLEKRAAATQR